MKTDDCTYTPWVNVSVCTKSCGTCEIEQKRNQSRPDPTIWKGICLELTKTIKYEAYEHCPSKSMPNPYQSFILAIFTLIEL